MLIGKNCKLNFLNYSQSFNFHEQNFANLQSCIIGAN